MNKQFNKLLMSQLFLSLGSTIYTVSIISTVLTTTNSILSTSIMPIAMTLGTVFCGLITPMLVAKYQMSDILKVSQIIAVIVFIIIGLSIQCDVVPIWVLSMLVCLFSFLTSFMYPLSLALIPEFVSTLDLVKANSLFQTVAQVVNIVSWLIGASLVVLFSQRTLLLMDTALFFLSFVCLVGLHSKRPLNNISEGSWTEFKKGWDVIREEPVVKLVLVMDVLESIANTAWVSSIILVYVNTFLHKGDQWWGYINATFFLGCMVGSLLVMAYETRINKDKSVVIFYGSLFGAIVTFLFSVVSLPAMSLLLSISVGLFSQMKNIPQVTVIQQSITPEKIASVYSASSVICSGVFSLSLTILSMLADKVGVNSVFIVSSFCLFIVTAITKKYVHYFR